MLILSFALYFQLAVGAPADMTKPVTRYADVTLRWNRGTLSVVRVTAGMLPRPTPLRRWRGRFEARALAGQKLLEFVRFDFPLLGAAESSDEMTPEAANFGKKLRAGVTATTTVRVPLPEGATAASIYDGDTRKSVAVTLPGSPPPPPTAGGGNTKR